MENKRNIWTLVKKMKIIDESCTVDALYLLFYLVFFAGVMSVFESSHLVFISLVALAILSLITIRDHVLSKQISPVDEIKSKIETIEGELTSIRLGQGIRELR